MGKNTSKDLGDILIELCPNVYWQPTTNIRIKYPCIIYERASGLITPADNLSYLYVKSYNITVIDMNPDSEIPDKIVNTFPMCRYDRHFVSDNLHHDVFSIYF